VLFTEVARDAASLLKRLFPEVTRGAAIEVPPLPAALALVHRELGGAIGRPVETSLRTRNVDSSGTETSAFLQSQDSLEPLSQRSREDDQQYGALFVITSKEKRNDSKLNVMPEEASADARREFPGAMQRNDGL